MNKKSDFNFDLPADYIERELSQRSVAWFRGWSKRQYKIKSTQNADGIVIARIYVIGQMRQF